MRFSLFIIVATLLLPLSVSAQLPGGAGASAEALTVSVSPQYPSPYSQATVTILSNSLDLANATLSVSVAGKNLYQGSVQPVSIPLGKAGSAANVAIVVSSAGSTYTHNLLIQPQDVALIAEPLSSAPPLYPGKPLVPLSGDVRVVAAASLTAAGRSLDPAALSYAWTVDGTRIADSSGIGKSALIVASPLQYRSREVSVTVRSQDGQAVGGASLSLNPVDPTVRLYANDPLLGILFDHALADSYAISGAESTLYAAPFSLPTTAGAPLIQWFLNGAAAQTGPSITLRPSGSGEGNASLSLTAGNGSSLATKSLYLSFGAAPTSNFFGL